MKIHDVAEWFIIADDDVETAEIIKDKKLNNAYYHCSQAVEKYLKSFLYANDITINYNHDITETLNKCISLNNSFQDIMNDCDKMTMSIKNLRYPGRMAATKEDVKFAFELVDNTKALKPIQELYNGIIAQYGVDWKNILFKNIINMKTDFSSKS